MDTVDIHTVITDLVRWNLDEADRARRFGGPRSMDAALREQARYTAATETLRQAILLRDYGALRDPIRHSLQRLGFSTEEGSDLWQEIGHEAAHALIDTTEEIARRDRGEFSERSFVFRSVQSASRPATHPLQPAVADPATLSFLSLPQAAPAAPVLKRQLDVSLPQPDIQVAQIQPLAAEAARTSAPAVQATEVCQVPPVQGDSAVESLWPEPATTAAPAEVNFSAEWVAPALVAPRLTGEQADPATEGSEEETEPSTAQNATVSVQAPRRSRQRPSQAEAAALLGMSKDDQRRCNAKLGNPNIPVGEVIDSYLADRAAGKSGKRVHETDSPGGRSAGQMENELSTGRLLKKFIGECPIINVTEKDLVEIFNVIQKLPNTYGRSNTETRHPRQIAEDHERKDAVKLDELRAELRTQGQSEANIADIIEEVRTPVLAANTVYRKMQEVQRFFGHAIAHRHIIFNPMDGVIWTSAEKDRRVMEDGDRSRIIWGNQLPRLFRTNRFQSWSLNPFDALVWATIIAVFTGARMEEILQLKVADFEMTDAGLVMHIRAGTNQTLKTKNSARRLPIHSRILELGLADLIEHRRIQGERYLFPDLERTSTAKSSRPSSRRSSPPSARRTTSIASGWISIRSAKASTNNCWTAACNAICAKPCLDTKTTASMPSTTRRAFSPSPTCVTPSSI